MEYKDPKDALKTHEEGGFKISNHEASFRFPTDETLKAAIDKLNDMMRNHELKPCPAGQECRLCFLTKASAESKVLEQFVEKTFHVLFGPLGHAIMDMSTYFAIVFFFYMLGETVNQNSPKDAAAEIEALSKMFGLPSENNSVSDDQKTAN